MEFRSRFVTTALLVLIALGGAGLAVAADRQQTEASRPEVTWAADNAARLYIDKLASDLVALADSASGVAKAGRTTLGSLQTLNLDAVRAAMDEGDAAGDGLAASRADLAADQARAAAAVDGWRVGSEVSDQLSAIGTASASAAQLPADWAAIKARATTVAGVVDDLQRHDGLVFRATTAGRQRSWADAISTMADASRALDSARGLRDSLGAATPVGTLDQLIARYAAYDSALSALYEYVGSGGQQTGSTFDGLSKAVDAAQAALPGDNGVFSVIVGEAAGTAITDALVHMEQARGDINAALDAITTATSTATSTSSPN